jgi:hypothetical protein
MATVVELRYGSVRSVACSPASGSPTEPIVAMPLSTGGGAESLVAVLAGSTLMTTSMDVSSRFPLLRPVPANLAFCAGLARSKTSRCSIIKTRSLGHTGGEGVVPCSCRVRNGVLQVPPVTLASVLGSLALGPQWPRSDARSSACAAAAALRVEALPGAAPLPDHTPAQRDVAAAAAEGPAASVGGLLHSVQLRCDKESCVTGRLRCTPNCAGFLDMWGLGMSEVVPRLLQQVRTRYPYFGG